MVTFRRPRGVIVIGASAGGLAALQDVVGGLPASIPAAVLIVVHFPPSERSHLSEILTRLGSLPAAEATDGVALAAGRIYTAPSGLRHMVVDDDLVHLVDGPKEHFARPAVDPLFRTAALAFGRRAIGVVLSGTNSDGTLGLREVKRLGGQSVVQTPADARYPGMPTSALRDGEVDACVPASEMGPLLASLVADFDRPARPPGDDLPQAAWSMARSRARRGAIDAPPMPGASSMKVDRELLLPPLLPDIVVTRCPQSQQTWERAVRSRDAARPAYDAAITLLVAV